DPPYGRAEFYGVPRPQELSFQGVFRVGSDAKSPVLLVDGFGPPNGPCLSGGGRPLFVNDTARKHIRLFDVKGDGTLSDGRVWAETVGEGKGAPDGMKIDSQGNVYCCGPGGIHVFSPPGGITALTPQAECLGVIHTPEPAANFAWGDSDCRSLFITASTSVFRIRTATPGLPVL